MLAPLVASTTVTSTVISGPFLLAAVIAFAAGAVSFASPCVVPLVPGYLAYLAGLVGAENDSQASGSATTMIRRQVRGRIVVATALFVLGFSLAFLAETAAVLGLSHVLLANSQILTRVGGAVTVIMGLAMLGWVRPLARDWRISRRPSGRILGAALLGGTFGLGWVVCIGPTLAGVIALATATDWNGSAWRGLFLVGCYCLGLGVPFLAMAFGFTWAAGAIAFLRRNARAIQVSGATMLIILRVLMLSGLWTQFMAWLQVLVSGSNTVVL